jgi:hypothetical protein
LLIYAFLNPANNHGGPGPMVELKTSMNIRDARDEARFEKYVLIVLSIVM